MLIAHVDRSCPERWSTSAPSSSKCSTAPSRSSVSQWPRIATVRSPPFASYPSPSSVWFVFSFARAPRWLAHSLFLRTQVAIDPSSGRPLKGSLRKVVVPEGAAQEIAAGATKRREERLQDKRILQRYVLNVLIFASFLFAHPLSSFFCRVYA